MIGGHRTRRQTSERARYAFFPYPLVLLLQQRNENRRTEKSRVGRVGKNTGEIQSRRNPATVMTARTVSRQFILLICEMN